MRFGMHVSIEGGVEKAPKRAFDAGCECFQIFSRSPHGGVSKKIDKKTAEDFRSSFEKNETGDFFIHSPYYINFASGNSRIYYGSVSAIRSEMEVADLLGAKGVVAHLGSAKDLGQEEAEKKLVEGICKVFEPSANKEGREKPRKFRTKLLLEITAGTGNIMGDTFEEIAGVIFEAEKILGKNTLGVCFDTAHAFASGYDLRDDKSVRNTFKEFERTVGIGRIGLVHLNDSLADLNSHIDRHANIGKGMIGTVGITAVLKELEEHDLDFVLETPPLRVAQDLDVLKKIRSKL